MKIKIKKGRK